MSVRVSAHEPTMRLVVLAVGLLIAGPTAKGMSMRRDNCGDECAVDHYCSKHNSLCTPCSNICDEGTYLEKECNAYCRAYQLTRVEHEYEALRSEVSRLWSIATAAIAVAFVSLVVAAYLVASRFVKWKTIGGALHRTFSGSWSKTTPVNKNNNHENNNKPEDAEAATHRRNGPKLAMPTISATVAPSRDPAIGRQKTVASGNGSGQIQVQVQAQGQGRGNEAAGNCTGADNGTPNTTTTTLSLSGRHPSEDTTLDYAYDNPAMTPSPESVQIRRDRESSF